MKKDGSVYLPLTEKDREQVGKKSSRPMLTKILILISSLAELSFICTSFVLQYAYGQSTATLEFRKPTSGFRWGIWMTFYAMAFVGCYRIWCYYRANWKLQTNPETNVNTQNMVSYCGISFAVLSFALEVTFLALALASTARLPGAPKLMTVAAAQLLGVVCCRLGVEVARNNRSSCALSGSVVCVYVLHVILLTAFLSTYGPLKGSCFTGLDYSSHIITAQCKPGESVIKAPCWLENKPQQIYMDAIVNHKPNTISTTDPFEVSFDGEKKKMTIVISYLEKSWFPKVYSAKVPQYSCSILEHGYCRSCSIEELSRLQVQIITETMRDGEKEVEVEAKGKDCLLPQAYDMEHNTSLSYKYCTSI